MSGNKKNPGRRRRFSRRPLVIAGLILFVAVDILLVAMALSWGRDLPEAAESNFHTEPDEPVEDEGQASDEDEPSPTGDLGGDEDQLQLQPVPRLVSVVNESVAWRSEGGACDDPGSLELTLDGGQTWGGAYPSADGLGRALWVSGADFATVQSAVASGVDCDLQGVRTFDSGASWNRDEQVVDNSVLVDPNDPSLLIWGGDVIQGPCADMNQVAVTGGVAGVICGDGSLWSSPSGSIEWTQTGIENAVALGGSDGRWITALESGDCEGLSLVEFDEASVESLACAPTEPGAETAIDVSGNVLWLWAGDQTLVSTDFGRSFNG